MNPDAQYTCYGDGWRLWLVDAAAKVARVRVHVEGIPFGYTRRGKRAASMAEGASVGETLAVPKFDE